MIVGYRRRLKRQLGYVRRKVAEFFGSDRYSRPALNDLDRKLERYLDFDHGYFVELGANDGLTQSNTYYFEALRGWSGVLIEPIPELCRIAAKLRRRSKVFNCACVSFDYPDSEIEITYLNLMSMVEGALKDAALAQIHFEQGKAHMERAQDRTPYTIRVPARTLTSVLEEAGTTKIDLLSLDVEGYELDVLKGLDFERYAPVYMLIEARFRDEIEAFILDRYCVVEQMSQMDVLYRHR